jgi:hypothetical protein
MAKVLKGANPAEVSVEQADRLARRQQQNGWKISEAFLVNAYEVID